MPMATVLFELYFWVTLSYWTYMQCFLIFWHLMFQKQPAIFFPVKMIYTPTPYSGFGLPDSEGFFGFFFFFKFKNITGFVLELSVLFQNFLEHSVLSLICIYSCLSISKKFSYNFTFGCIFYFILWILFQHITLVLYNFCISFLLAFS